MMPITQTVSDKLKVLFFEVKKMIEKREIIWRNEESGALVVILKGRNAGTEYYVGRGTRALLNLIKEGMSSPEEILNDLIANGLQWADAEKLLINHLQPFILSFSEFARKDDVITGYWHPPDTKMPHVIGWELSWRCNLRCVYCFSSSGEIKNPSYKELPTEDIYKIIDKIHGKILFVWLGGGEPTLRRDLIDIIRYLNKKDFFIQLSTNGVPLYGKNELIKEISELVHEVHIPLDGSTPEVHNSLRGEYIKTLKVLQQFVKLKGNASVTTGTVITKRNINNWNSNN